MDNIKNYICEKFCQKGDRSVDRSKRDKNNKRKPVREN